MLLFPGFGGPDRSFRPDVDKDARPKTSSFGRRTEHVKTGHVKTDRFRGHFVGTSVDTLVGRFVGPFVGSPRRGETGK